MRKKDEAGWEKVRKVLGSSFTRFHQRKKWNFALPDDREFSGFQAPGTRGEVQFDQVVINSVGPWGDRDLEIMGARGARPPRLADHFPRGIVQKNLDPGALADRKSTRL